ncbi:ribosomal protein S27AE [Microbacterium sp. ZKA21]|uniref:hypothetical protein n=1 Tax=Microbacterium sp. ZKA21 TaxID=3381694 RepID=UPI003D216F77
MKSGETDDQVRGIPTPETSDSGLLISDEALSPRCPSCGVLLGEVTDGWRCAGCGHLVPVEQVEKPDDGGVPGIRGY